MEELIEINLIKIKEHSELILECKTELKQVRSKITMLENELNGEIAEEEQLNARLNRLLNQKSFLSGLVEGMQKREELV